MATQALDLYRCGRCNHRSADAVCPRCGFPESLSLPGMETADAERREARGLFEAEEMSEKLNAPLGSINKAADEMELYSPLFRGTSASPQVEMFQSEKRSTANENLCVAAVIRTGCD